MIPRRKILVALSGVLLAPLRAFGKPARMAKEPIPDAMLGTFGTPYLDRMLVDREFRRAFMKQTERVWGKKFRELCYLTALDEHPEIKRFPRIDRALRRNLGL